MHTPGVHGQPWASSAGMGTARCQTSANSTCSRMAEGPRYLEGSEQPVPRKRRLGPCHARGGSGPNLETASRIDHGGATTCHSPASTLLGSAAVAPDVLGAEVAGGG